MDISTEIRKLPPGTLRHLVEILEYGDSWKRLTEIIPKTLQKSNFNCSLTSDNCAKYNSEHFRLIEDASHKFRRRNSEILLDEWGTSGKVRPSLGHLLDLLKKAELFRAADYIAVDILGLQQPARPKNGPAALVTFDLPNDTDNNHDKTMNNNIDRKNSKKNVLIPKIIINGDSSEVSDMIKFSTDVIEEDLPRISALLKQESDNIPCISILMNNTDDSEADSNNIPAISDLLVQNNIRSSLPHISYTVLDSSTNHFDENSDRFLGKGSFGSVYLADGLLNSKIAVKKLQFNASSSEDKFFKQFKNELEILCNINHENLLPIRGFSCDGPTYCILYDYISGGDLEKALKNKKETIAWTHRLMISSGICEAIYYLHTAFDSPIIHRDIKSANILLTAENGAKLCDFGVIKILNENDISDTIIGTDVYMAPEVFREGDVSEKSDIFSFGVVILELLTASPPFDENRENADLVSHVNDVCENKSIEALLDLSCGNWNKNEINFANELFSIGLQCLEEKPKRPDNNTLRELLNKLCTSYK